MKILIADDDPVSRRILEVCLKSKGWKSTSVADGQRAWDVIQDDAFSILITDFDMPEVDGFELTRRLRAARRPNYTYIILLTSLGGKTNYLAAIKAGADDFMTKPIDLDVLYARLHVAKRILGLRQHAQTLERLLPICAGCKKIRLEDDQWEPIETYVSKLTRASFTHGLCPDCLEKALEDAGLKS